MHICPRGYLVPIYHSIALCLFCNIAPSLPLQSSWLGYSALTRATRVRVPVAELSLCTNFAKYLIICSRAIIPLLMLSQHLLLTTDYHHLGQILTLAFDGFFAYSWNWYSQGPRTAMKLDLPSYISWPSFKHSSGTNDSAILTGAPHLWHWCTYANTFLKFSHSLYKHEEVCVLFFLF